MFTCVWDITSKCNLNCTHCYNAEKYSKEKQNNDLSYEESMKFIDFLADNSYYRLGLLGGEPLIAPHFSEVLQRCDEKGIKVAITTNGLLLKMRTPDIIQSSVYNLNISIDGSTAEIHDAIRGKGVFDKVIEGITYFLQCLENTQKELDITIAFCVTAQNVGTAHQMVDLCKRVGIKKLMVTPLINSGEAMNDWEASHVSTSHLLDATENIVRHSTNVYPGLTIVLDARPQVIWYLNKKYPVHVVYSLGHTRCLVQDVQLLYVQANGELHPCGLYTQKSGKKAVEEGYFNNKDAANIRGVETLDDIFQSEYYRKFSTSMRELEYYSFSDDCTDCPTRKDCYPCPFQYRYGNEECSWVRDKIDNLAEDIAGWCVVSIRPQLIKLVDPSKKDVFSCLTEDSILANYEAYKAHDESKSLLEYLSDLVSQEDRFILKIERR